MTTFNTITDAFGNTPMVRINKINESDALEHLRVAGWIILVHGWRKNKNGRYELKEIDIS
jgi:hypothetical protein